MPASMPWILLLSDEEAPVSGHRFASPAEISTGQIGSPALHCNADLKRIRRDGRKSTNSNPYRCCREGRGGCGPGRDWANSVGRSQAAPDEGGTGKGAAV